MNLFLFCDNAMFPERKFCVEDSAIYLLLPVIPFSVLGTNALAFRGFMDFQDKYIFNSLASRFDHVTNI